MPLLSQLREQRAYRKRAMIELDVLHRNMAALKEEIERMRLDGRLYQAALFRWYGYEMEAA